MSHIEGCLDLVLCSRNVSPIQKAVNCLIEMVKLSVTKEQKAPVPSVGWRFHSDSATASGMPTDRKRKSGRPRGDGQRCVEKLLFFFFYLLVKTAPVSLATGQSTGERRSGLELRLQSTSSFTRCHPHTPNSIAVAVTIQSRPLQKLLMHCPNLAVPSAESTSSSAISKS